MIDYADSAVAFEMAVRHNTGYLVELLHPRPEAVVAARLLRKKTFDAERKLRNYIADHIAQCQTHSKHPTPSTKQKKS